MAGPLNRDFWPTQAGNARLIYTQRKTNGIRMMDDELDNVADYAAPGRKYAGLSKQALSAAWVHSFRNMPSNLLMRETTESYADYTAEYAMRGLRPPFHLIALGRLQAAMTSWMRGLPLEALAEFTEHMHAQALRTRELN